MGAIYKAMMFYLTIVAIFNVFLGVVLGILMPPSKILPVMKDSSSGVSATNSNEAMNGSEPVESMYLNNTANLTSTFSNDEHADDQTVPNPEASNRNKNCSASKTWADFAAELKDIGTRTRYSISVEDASLGRQVHAQLQTFMQLWYATLEKCVLGDASESVASLMETASLPVVEMLVAQIETSLTNVDMVDWSNNREEAFVVLLRELSLLEVQHKNVLSSKTSSGSKRAKLT